MKSREVNNINEKEKEASSGKAFSYNIQHFPIMGKYIFPYLYLTSSDIEIDQNYNISNESETTQEYTLWRGNSIIVLMKIIRKINEKEKKTLIKVGSLS